MIDIHIKTIPQSEQRYQTLGDYVKTLESNKDGNRIFESILVSDVGNHDMEFLTAIHELIEWYLTERRGINEEDITKFDIEHPELEEPGDDPRAPYHKEHMFASSIEKLLCKELGISDDQYTDFWKDIYGKLFPNNS